MLPGGGNTSRDQKSVQEVPSDGVGDMEEVERRCEGCVSGQRLWACTWQKEGTQPCRLTEEGACWVGSSGC